jgi:hypothetical protein
LTPPTLAPAAPWLVSRAPGAARASLDVIELSVIAIGWGSEDDAIVVEDCQRLLVSMHRKIEIPASALLRETPARTRKLLAIRPLQRNVGGGSPAWTSFATGSSVRITDRNNRIRLYTNTVNNLGLTYRPSIEVLRASRHLRAG